MYTKSIIFLGMVLLVFFVKSTLSCNGYELQINNVRNCATANVIRIDSLNATLTPDCYVIPKGCVTITKPFKTATGHYSANKPPMPEIAGDEDFCKLITDPRGKIVLEALNLPPRCPMKNQKHCSNGNKKINVSKYKSQLGLMMGSGKIKVDIKHDSGISCMEIDWAILRIRRG